MKSKYILLIAGLLVMGLAVPAIAQTAAPYPGPTTGPVPGQPWHQPGGDHRRQIRIGINKIDAALNHLASAGDDWGGHRAAAMQNLQAAKQELVTAMEYEDQLLGH
jgi:hypothetical protein